MTNLTTKAHDLCKVLETSNEIVGVSYGRNPTTFHYTLVINTVSCVITARSADQEPVIDFLNKMIDDYVRD